MILKIFKSITSLKQRRHKKCNKSYSSKSNMNTPNLLRLKIIYWKNKRFYADFPNKKENNGENLSVVLHGIKNMRLENRPIPKIKSNQVLLQMEVVGICGSDVHYYVDGRIGPFVVKEPMVIGHEASGTVKECGTDVKNLKPGDKVAIEPQSACRKCSYCKTGNYHLCPYLFFCATPPDDGNLSRYYAHDADFCHKLPSNLDVEHGTLMEPLAVGIHCCKRAKITNGDSVLILGSGPIGLVSLLAAKAYGASKTVVLDINDFKLKKAKEVGADYAINIKGCSVEDIVKIIHDTLGHKPNKTIECCGFEQAYQVGLYATESGGKIALAGMGKDFMSLPISEVVNREIDLIGIFRYVNDYPTAIDLVESGKINPKPLITHHFKLEDSIEAFKSASDKNTDFIKMFIHANPNWTPTNNC